MVPRIRLNVLLVCSQIHVHTLLLHNKLSARLCHRNQNLKGKVKDIVVILTRVFLHMIPEAKTRMLTLNVVISREPGNCHAKRVCSTRTIRCTLEKAWQEYLVHNMQRFSLRFLPHYMNSDQKSTSSYSCDIALFLCSPVARNCGSRLH